MKKAPQHLLLLRHGHTIWHNTDGVAGVTDIALSERGEASATALGARLTQHFDQWVWTEQRHWYVSPMLRTRQTLQRVQQTIGQVDAVEDARLKELDFGAWEGMTWSDVHAQQGELLAHWGENWLHTPPPGGEAFSAHMARAKAWLVEATRKAAADQSSIVAVCHYGTIKALLAETLQLAPKTVMDFSINPASFTHLTRSDSTSDEPWVLHALNH